MEAASSEAGGLRERLRRFWIKSVASGRYNRLEGGLRVAREEIDRRIRDRAPASGGPMPKLKQRTAVLQKLKAVFQRSAEGPGPAAIAVTDEARWASAAEELLAEAEKALAQCQIDQGWRLLHAARRAEILALDQTELQHRATVLRAEADKLRSWRQKAVQRLLGTPDKPEANMDRSAVFEAATLRDEHYDNQAYKDQLLRTQMLALVLILVGVMASLLLFAMTGPGAVQGGGSSNVSKGDIATFGMIALFGLLGATVSGMLRASDSGQSARIPELTAAIRVTFMRVLMGGASAVMIYVFLRSSLGSSLGTSLFSKGIAEAVKELQPYTAYAIAFVAGFSERLVLRAVEAVAGKGEDKAGGTSA